MSYHEVAFKVSCNILELGEALFLVFLLVSQNAGEHACALFVHLLFYLIRVQYFPSKYGVIKLTNVDFVSKCADLVIDRVVLWTRIARKRNFLRFPC